MNQNEKFELSYEGYIDATNLESLLSLRNELSAKYNKNQLDSFSLYV